MTYVYRNIIFLLVVCTSLALPGCDKWKHDRENDKGMNLIDNEQYAEAVEHFSKIIEEDKNYLPAYFNRAICYSFLNKTDVAIADLTFVISKQKFEEGAYLNRAILYENQKKYKQAIKDYSSVLKIAPDNAKAYHYRGICKYYEGNYQEAIVDYDRAIKMGLNSSGVLYNKAVALNCLGKYSEAIKFYGKAIKVDKKLGRAYFARGVVKLKNGDKEAAVADLKMSLKLGISKAKGVLEQVSVSE